MSTLAPIDHNNTNSSISSSAMRALELTTSPVSPTPPVHFHHSVSTSSHSALLPALNPTNPPLPSPPPNINAPYPPLPTTTLPPPELLPSGLSAAHSTPPSPHPSSVHPLHNLRTSIPLPPHQSCPPSLHPPNLHLPLHNLPPHPVSLTHHQSWHPSASPSTPQHNLRAPPPSAETTPHHPLAQRHPLYSHNEPDRMVFAKTLDDVLSTSLIKNEQQICQYADLNSQYNNPPRVQQQLVQLQQHNQWLHQQQLHQLLHDRFPQRVDPLPLPEPFSMTEVIDMRTSTPGTMPPSSSTDNNIHIHSHPNSSTVTLPSVTVAPTITTPSTPISVVPSPTFKLTASPPTPHTRTTLALIDRCADLTKPINTLGPLCFAGFYLVSLTRTIVRNRTVPLEVRKAFMAPQLHFSFTVRDNRDVKWRNIPTVQIPYDSLSAAGDWLRLKLNVHQEQYTFKHIKDALQKAVTDAWADSAWGLLVDTLREEFDDVSKDDLEDALHCSSISGRASGTPPQYFNQVNCHKGAPDIRRDVDGAISARESLKWVLSHLGLNANGCNISIAKFRDEVFPLWKHHCQYVREHEVGNCCHFYSGGYFKKIMIHKHLYNVNGCTSSYHVKDLFEGLDEVIKVWSNPTGMCVREAKCAAGLRYNVDKSFQSGIRSYSKAKFLEAAPHTAQEFVELERELHSRVQGMIKMKTKKYSKCRRALRLLEVKSNSVAQRQVPDVLRAGTPELPGTPCSAESPGSRKRKRQERDDMFLPSTPREQKRKHAHLSLKRKEVAEQQVKQYLELVRGDCQKQQGILDSAKRHGEECSCHEEPTTELTPTGRYPTSANTPVA